MYIIWAFLLLFLYFFPLASVFPAIIVLCHCRQGKKIQPYTWVCWHRQCFIWSTNPSFPPFIAWPLFQVISQNEADYFFDSLRQVTDWNRRNKPGKDGKEKASMTRNCMRHCVELGKQQIYPVTFTPSWEACGRALYLFCLYIHSYCLHQQ